MRHVREVEKILVVLKGTGRIVTNDDSVEIGEGQAVIVPPSVHHYHENPGEMPFRQLLIFAPPCPERAIRVRSGGEDV